MYSECRYLDDGEQLVIADEKDAVVWFSAMAIHTSDGRVEGNVTVEWNPDQNSACGTQRWPKIEKLVILNVPVCHIPLTSFA